MNFLSIQVAEWLVRLTSDREVPGSNPAGDRSAHVCMVLHYIKPFIVTLPLSPYNLSNVERDVKHQIIMIYEFL